MEFHSLVIRSWNDTPISRRTSDGYVNATAMCKANGKRWKDYRESERCLQYLAALESVAGISGHALIESRSGGAGGGGTWVHPQVAIDLARWISAPFAVWMDGWFLEGLRPNPAPVAEADQPMAKLRQAAVIALVERSIGLFQRLGGIDQRDQLLFKDIVRGNLLTATAGVLPNPPADQEVTLSDAWLEVFQQVLLRSQYGSVGKLVAEAYRKEFNQEPPLRQQFVDGAPRQVKSYRRIWLLLTLKRLREQLADR